MIKIDIEGKMVRKRVVIATFMLCQVQQRILASLTTPNESMLR